jgi:hypothetical protein
MYSLSLSIGGCRKFVRIDPPDNTLVTATVFNNSITATAAVLSIYTQMAQESYNMSLKCGLLSDELRNNSNDGSAMEYYTNSMDAISTPNVFWSNSYNYIYQANAIIQAMNDNKDIDVAINHQLTGEAKFIRAYYYFYLANCYGDVPLVTSTDYTINSQLPRTARSSIYQQIIKDLEDAETLLSSNFVDQSDTAVAVDRVRPTKWAAAALLARTYLYTGDYVKAEMKATEVINNSSLFMLEPDLDKVFLTNSAEAIWQLDVATPTQFAASGNTFDGYAFILNAAPNNGGTNNISTISSQLLSSFEAGDQRQDKWIGAFTTDSPSITYLFPYKYKVHQSDTIKEYTMMLRLSEQYLIRAEARAQNNADPTSILQDIDTIRHRAGLPDYSGGTDKQSLLDAILHERQVELFTEWGHRWFDLIRINKINQVMDTVTPMKGGHWNPNWQLFPIPQSERKIDIHLSQNDGY